MWKKEKKCLLSRKNGIFLFLKKVEDFLIIHTRFLKNPIYSHPVERRAVNSE